MGILELQNGGNVQKQKSKNGQTQLAVRKISKVNAQKRCNNKMIAQLANIRMHICICMYVCNVYKYVRTHMLSTAWNFTALISK